MSMTLLTDYLHVLMLLLTACIHDLISLLAARSVLFCFVLFFVFCFFFDYFISLLTAYFMILCKTSLKIPKGQSES